MCKGPSICAEKYNEIKPLLGDPVGEYAGIYMGHDYKLGAWYHSRCKDGKDMH